MQVFAWANRNMNDITYNIPTNLLSEYKDRQVIVRSYDPAEIVRTLSEATDLNNVQYVQLLAADVSPAALDIFANWSCGVPLDIAVRNPGSEYPLLYNFAKLAAARPVRVSIAVKPGFKKAVKLALALHFAVRLDVGQPDEALVEELSEVLDFYLHSPNVQEPVEYFHSVFLAFYRDEEMNLRIIQEEDPEYFRFVDDNGAERISPRLGEISPESFAAGRLNENPSGKTSEHDCDSCEFSRVCGVFFKWTDAGYDCRGVKSIFGTLKAAAAELRKDVVDLGARQNGGVR